MSEPKYKLTFVNDGPPCAEKDVAAFEKSIVAKLPPDYRDFLLLHNGAQPVLDGLEYDSCIVRVQWQGKPAGAGGKAASVGHFLRLRAVSPEIPDIRETLADFAGRIPSETIPIADHPGGGLFLLALRGSDAGAVFFWSRKFRSESLEDTARSYPNVGFVAPSFTAFLEAMEPEPADWEQWERDNA